MQILYTRGFKIIFLRYLLRNTIYFHNSALNFIAYLFTRESNRFVDLQKSLFLFNRFNFNTKIKIYIVPHRRFRKLQFSILEKYF